MSQTFLNMQPSETAVAHCAARIYSAYIASGKVVQGQEMDWIRKAVGEAIALAQTTDAAIQSDDEKLQREYVEF